MKKKLFVLIPVLFAFFHSNAQSYASYYRLQAVYIYNFAKYIKWTNEPSPFVIGVFGQSEISDLLQSSLEGKKIGSKALEIRSFNKIEDIEQCQIIYLPKSKSKQLSAINNFLTGKRILVVTEEDLSRKGAGISFFTEDNNLKFKLNHDILTKSGLTPSSGLLALAIVIYEK